MVSHGPHPVHHCAFQSAVVELEHFIGYGGKHLGTLRYHPLEALGELVDLVGWLQARVVII